MSVTVLQELQRDNMAMATHRFFLRAGRKAREPWRDEWTLPLFGLPLIMDAEGVLARDARHLVDDDAAYLMRCNALIRSVSLELP